MGYKSGYKAYQQHTPRRKKYVRLLGRCGNTAKSLASAVLKDPDVCKLLVIGIGKIIKFEVKTLCCDRVNSVQRSASNEDITHFPWKKVMDEAIEHCPMLLSFLFASTATKAVRLNQLHFICTIVCMLSKFHYNRMSLFQKVISAILYAGHAGTVVNSTCICLLITSSS